MNQVLAFNNEGAAKVISGRIDPLNQRAVVEMENLLGLQQSAAAAVLRDQSQTTTSCPSFCLSLAPLRLPWAACSLLQLREALPCHSTRLSRSLAVLVQET